MYNRPKTIIHSSYRWQQMVWQGIHMFKQEWN